MLPPILQRRIDNFAAMLWQYALLRATGTDRVTLGKHVREVKQALEKTDPIKNSTAIGESLCSQILNHTVLLTRSNYPAEKLAEEKVILAQAVFSLDGAYGLSASEMLSVVARFIEEMEQAKKE